MDIDQAPQVSAKSATVPETPTKKRKSAAGRQLIRWDFEKDQLLLLALEYECAQGGINLPWDKAVQHILPGATGQAAQQHLSKVRIFRRQREQPNPPEIGRRRTMLKATPNPPNKRNKISTDQVELSTPQSLRGSATGMVFEKPAKTPRRAKGVTFGDAKPQTTAKKSTRRRPKKVKEESDGIDSDDDDWSPTRPGKGPAGRLARRTSLTANEGASGTNLIVRLRHTDGVNYAVPDLSDDDIAEEADTGDDNYQEGAPYMDDNEDVKEEEEEDQVQQDSMQEMPPPPKPVIMRSPTARDANLIKSTDPEDPFSAAASDNETSSFTAAMSSMHMQNFTGPFHNGNTAYTYMHSNPYEENTTQNGVMENTAMHTPTRYIPPNTWAQPSQFNNGFPTTTGYIADNYQSLGYLGYGNYTYQPVFQQNREHQNSFDSESSIQSQNTIPSPHVKTEPDYFSTLNTPVVPLGIPPQHEIHGNFSNGYADVAASSYIGPDSIIVNQNRSGIAEAQDTSSASLLQDWTHHHSDANIVFGHGDNDTPMSTIEQP